MELTEEQFEVIQHTRGHAVVLAGPGSGKTRTATEKIAYIFENDVIPEPFGVLAITFTNSAVNVMQQRLRQMGFSAWNRIFIGTFHSFSKYLLSCYGSDVGIREDFEIADSEIQKELIKEIQPGLDSRGIYNIYNVIANQKQSGIYPGKGDEKLSSSLRQIYHAYQHQLQQRNLLDYGDLIHFTISLMNNSLLAPRLFMGFFRYVIVDEFQDTDHQQLELVKIFAKGAIGSTIVADDDQSVFEWRGADRRNIEAIQKFLKADMYQLGINFRSDQAIVAAANAVINQEKNRQQKNIQANSVNAGKIFVECFDSEEQEASAIATWIKQHIDSKVVSDLGQFALIVRSRYRSSKITSTLGEQKINYFDRSQLLFDDGWETIFALCLLGLACDPGSSDRFYSLLSSVDMGGLSDKFGIRDGLEFVMSLREEICNDMPCKPTTAAIQHILDCANYWNILKAGCWSETDYKNKCKNIDNMIQNVERMAQENQQGLLEAVDQLAGYGAVQILSGQESKGREFDTVFFAGLEEGVIPDYRSKTEEKISEERRIFYVAITRAKKEIYLSYADFRPTKYGKLLQQQRSRFIDAIPKHLISTF
jgi:DNA helicase II / ATP-dependent DNA helicase PcrA